MDTAPLTPHEVRDYLDLLGVARERPDLRTLRALVRAHLLRIPFENVSKLFYLARFGLRGVPDVARYLDGIRRHGFGGTCYSNNLHFSRLLAALGFEAVLCGADMPSGEDVHTAITVTIGYRPWLVDSGNAAPFLAPIRLDLDHPYELRFGADRYVLQPRDELGRSRLELWRDGEHTHGYLLKPGPVRPDRFDAVVQGSFRPAATFMNAVLLVRCFPRHVVRIINLSLIRSTRTRATVTALADRDALLAAVEREIGIPSAITREALAGIAAFAGLYG